MDEIIIDRKESLVSRECVTSDLFERWITFLDAKPKTVQTYSRAIRQFMRWLQENGIQKPTRNDILLYRKDLFLQHKPATVQAYIMAVRQFFKWTEQEGLYRNIACNIKGAKLDKGFKKDYLTSKQARKLLEIVDTDSIKGLRDYAILALMITTGLRTIEVERANIEDLRVVADFTALFVQGKGHLEKTEYVKVEEPVENAIRAYLRARGEYKASDALFASVAHRNFGGRMTTRSISRIAKENMIEADLNSERLTAHSLRHTAATLNLLNGGTPEETMQLLRHASLNTTLIYSHALERAKNQSETRIAKAIFLE